MKDSLQTVWTSHLKGEQEKQEFRDSVRALLRGPVISRLKEILDSKIASVERPCSIQDYDNASWSHRQAHQNGELQAYLTIRQILGDK